MRFTRRLPLLRRLSSLSALSLVGAALLMAGCSTDTPTDTGSGSSAELPATAFSITPGAMSAAKTSLHQVVRTLGTLSNRQLLGSGKAGALGGGGGGDDNGVINSPLDLTYVGGPVVTTARNWNIYVNCPTTAADCWGNGQLGPGTFLRDLNRSSFIGVVNQYLGSSAYGQFPTSDLSLNATFTDTALTLNDIYSIVYSASLFTGASGYNNIFHVFLTQGQDMCISPTVCYSPDNFNTWVFCAFHGSVDVGTTHLLYSVEPYQGVAGCEFPTHVPHGLIDATTSTLSHEFFETISDPDLDAWFNVLTQDEMADLCAGFANNERIGHHYYSIQLEYSNAVHACTDGA
ncbi:MAG TPA: hypothetical protein VMG41_12265 [Gemmatimonadales bacterium]|nr:hypothetical protein [Gemmatimonadales bacterium]